MHGAGVGRVPGGPAEDHTVDGHLHAGIMGAVLWLTEQILKCMNKRLTRVLAVRWAVTRYCQFRTKLSSIFIKKL